MVDSSSFIGWDDNRDYLLPAYSVVEAANDFG